MTRAVDRARSARSHRRHDGHAVRGHRRFDRHPHLAAGRSVRRAARREPATATPSSPMRWPRARPARWCIATCRTPAACCWWTTRWPALHRLGGYARAALHRPAGRGHRQRRQDHDQGDAADHPGRVRPTHAAVASYNNHWGLPLTLARMPPRRRVLRRRDRHEPCRRDRAAGAAGAAACRGDHRGGEGAYRLSRLDRGDRRREGRASCAAWSRAASRCCRPIRRCCRGCAPRPARPAS